MEKMIHRIRRFCLAEDRSQPIRHQALQYSVLKDGSRSVVMSITSVRMGGRIACQKE